MSLGMPANKHFAQWCISNSATPVEQCNVHLTTRLSAVVIKEHDYIIHSTHFWTDSTMFRWICGVSEHQPDIIANRIDEILDTTEPNQWNHCPGDLNPADDGSRGTSSELYYTRESLAKWPCTLTLS